MITGNGSDEAAMEYGLRYNPPVDVAVAERTLKETKQILHQLGVVFLLFSGSCLGAIRDKAIIPWDDDIDLISVMGMNGLTEEKMDSVIAVFRGKGYYHKRNYSSPDAPPYGISHSFIKDYARVDWNCMYVTDGAIVTYPGVQIPAEMCTKPIEIEFLDEKFLVPNPPEEYLCLKYGPEWRVPKRAGEYEQDVVAQVSPMDFIGGHCRLRVLDHEHKPVPGAEIVLAGGGISKTDKGGYADIVLPVTSGMRYYAMVIRYPGHEQVLYEEQMEPDKTYVYRTDSYSTKASAAVGAFGTLGSILLPE